MHPRQQIREAVAARLAQQLPDGGYWTPAETRVHTSRSIEIVPEELPLVLVLAREETSEQINSSDFDGGLRRTLTLNVEGLAEALDDVEDTLDDLALGIEGALDGLLITNNEQAHLQLVRTELDVDREGELPLGAIRLTYEIRYTSYRLGVDFGLWDRDYPDNCPAPGITSITLRTPNGSSVDSKELVI